MHRRRPRPQATRPFVLLAEDHDDTRALYAIALSAMGFEVLPVKGSSEAYARAWELHPDIIVCVLALDPAASDDRWTLVGQLKAESRTREIPVVVLAGDSRMPARERALREGCAACFVQPCGPDQLAAGLRQVLAAASP